MKNYVVFLVLSFSFFVINVSAQHSTVKISDSTVIKKNGKMMPLNRNVSVTYSKVRLLVKYKEPTQEVQRKIQRSQVIQGVDSAMVDKINKRFKVRSSKRAYGELKNKSLQSKLGINRWYKVEFPRGVDINKIAKEYKSDPNVEEVTLDYAVKLHSAPNDLYYSNQWGHNNTGQLPVYNAGTGLHDGSFVGTVGFDSRLENAYGLLGNYGSSSVVVGIVDTGIDSDHPDLSANIVAGAYFGDGTTNTEDVIGHGTMCAGIVAAQANNGIGIAGVAGNCKIMPLRIDDSEGLMYLSAVQNALYYAADNGCDVVNMSFGFPGVSTDPSTDAAIEYAYNAGVILLASTGNDNHDYVEYPSCNQYVIAVGAASPCENRKSPETCDGESWWGSSYGDTLRDGAASVDVIAPTIIPATDIAGAAGYTTGDYDLYANGTSSSTAFTSGVCALIKSLHPDWTVAQVRRQLTLGASDINDGESTSGWDKYSGYGMVNAYESLVLTPPTDNPPVFTASGPFTIIENLPQDSVVCDMNADNGDGGGTDGGIVYSIVTNANADEDENDAFVINSSTGVITVNDVGDVNYTPDPIYITVRANDGFASTDIVVTINIVEVPNRIIYVNAYATSGLKDGTSWANGYLKIQDALQWAVSGDQIWVSRGHYYSASSSSSIVTMKTKVGIYGGFLGNETSLSQRDFVKYKTVLSGDYGNDDINTDYNRIAESADDIVGSNGQIVYAVSVDETSVLDGFTITAGGQSSGCWYGGSGIMNLSGSKATYKNLIICGNKSVHLGGAVYNSESSPTFINVTFSGNKTTDVDASGGAMYSQYGGNATLINATFDNNFANRDGGGFAADGGTHYLENVTFSNNTAGYAYGGGLFFDTNVNATLKNVSFTHNTAPSGGGMCVYYNGTITMTDVSFIENNAVNNGTGTNHGGGLLLSGGPIVNATNLTFKGNVAHNNGGGVSLYNPSTLNLVNAIFIGNKSTSGNGGGLSTSYGTANITNASFNGNWAASGGALAINNSGSINSKNCIIWNNYPNEIFGSFNMSYSNVYQSSGVYSGTGNINADPLFVIPVDSANVPTTTGDLRLLKSSPCVNSGNNADNISEKDVRGQARIQDTTIDMGAYEWTQDLDPENVILYVNASATGTNNGDSWENAYNSLQSALNNAKAGDEIWIAKGTYKPVSAYNQTNSSRYYHFELIIGVGIYGGFAGTETAISQRTDFGSGGSNETVLSGDIGTVGDSTDNCYHVIFNDNNGITASAILNGVTISGGNANGTNPHNRGGGLYQRYSTPTISQVIFTGNTGNYGGGVFNHGTAPAYTDCLFFGNHGNSSGGGMRNNYATTTITNCTFTNNTSGSVGGGVDNTSSTSVYNNCIFWGNTAASGNQIYATGTGSITLNNSCYSKGTNDVVADAETNFVDGVSNLNVNPLFVNPTNNDFRLFGNSPCINIGDNTFNTYDSDIRGKSRIQNTTIDLGAYEWTEGTDPECRILYVNDDASGINDGTNWANAYTSLQSALGAAVSGDEIWVAKGTYKPTTEVGGTGARYAAFQMKNNVTIYGGFAGTETALTQRSDFGYSGTNETCLSGDIGTQDDNSDNCYHVFYHPVGLGLTSTAILDGFTITHGNGDSASPFDRGAAMYNAESAPTLNNIAFISNSGTYAGAVYNYSCSPSFTNCLFAENTAVNNAGALECSTGGAPVITNCTFTKNHAGGSAGAINIYTNPQPVINNCILWGNTATAGNQIVLMKGSVTKVTLRNSCYPSGSNEVVIQSTTTATIDADGTNISSDPLFINAANHDYRLFGNSPAVNTGSNDYCAYATDIRGEERIQNTTIDMGAFEWTDGTDMFSKILYVNDDAAGSNNGLSWTNAFTSLQSALDIAANGNEIWVAKGTYKPSSAYSMTNTSRYYHFELIEGVNIYGGFSGTETALTQRTDFGYGATNESILSGDLNGDDVVSGAGTSLSFSNNAENCYHVIYNAAAGISTSTVLDGFTITGGNASVSPNNYGGGIYMANNSPTINNVAIVGNSAGVRGGGAYNINSSGVYTNCLFTNNQAGIGGGYYAESSTGLVLTNCVLYGNKATLDAGGIASYKASLSCNNCIIYGNSAVNSGNQLEAIGNSTEPAVITLNYSCYANGTNDVVGTSYGTIVATNNNITSDPLFVDAGNNDFRLYGNSPAVSAGNNSYNTSTTDIRGNERIQNTTIDMGVYEWTSGIDPAKLIIQWTGSLTTDWNTAGNWSPASIPAATDDIVINDVANDPEIGPDVSATINNLTVNTGASLTIQSDATGTGSLIVNGTATGDVTIQSYLAETGKWHVVAAPVTAQNIWSFATLAGNSIAENASKRAVTEYIESTNTWDTNYPTADTEGSFSAGSGYSVLRSSPGVVAYTGTLNTSDVTKPLTRSLYGWNALGNPYPSAINATVTAHETNNLITANTAVFDPSFAALYLWDAATNTYVTINNTGDGTLVQNYIQTGQGFFVRAKDNTGLNFSITEAMQTHQTSTPLKSGETAWPTIQLAVRANAKQSSTVLTFNNQMTNGLDITYDAGMFKADKNFALYSRLVDDNDVDFAIQALPESYDKLVVPLGIDVQAGTEIIFAAKTINLPSDAAVYLEDRAAKNITRLDVDDAKYTVTVTEATKGTGNFFLHTSAATTAVNELENNLKVYTRDRAIYISGNLNSDDVVAVYGVDGKLHYRKNSEKTGLLRIDAAKMPAGVYLISIQQNTGRVTRKVVISE